MAPRDSAAAFPSPGAGMATAAWRCSRGAGTRGADTGADTRGTPCANAGRSKKPDTMQTETVAMKSYKCTRVRRFSLKAECTVNFARAGGCAAVLPLAPTARSQTRAD